MKYLKRFNENNTDKYIMIMYNKMIDGYPEKTAIIVDSMNNIVDNIDLLFTEGEYSDEALSKMQQYNIAGKTVANGKDLYMYDITDQTEALDKYIDEVETTQKINKFLTPEKQAELIDLFKKKRFNENTKNFKSLKELRLGLKHLYPNKESEYHPDSSWLSSRHKGYIVISFSKKDYIVVSYGPSEYGGEPIGLAWIKGDLNSGFEFTTLQELDDIVKSQKLQEAYEKTS